MLKVALIGYGYSGRTLHAPLITCVPGIALVAVVSSGPAKVLADYPQVAVCATMDALPDVVDAVVIATPNHSHFELAKQALLAGKHVVVDKPFTVSVIQASELKVLAENKGLVLSVFHNRRWDADFLTLSRLMASGELGELLSFESRFDRFRPEVRLRWREQAGLGTGLWYDLGPHLLDQAVQLFGSPLSIQATLEVQRPNAVAVDYFHVRLQYQSFVVNLHAGMFESVETPRYCVVGQRGRYTKYGLDRQEEAFKRGELPSDANWGHDPQNGVLETSSMTSNVTNLPGDYRHFYSGFRDCIASGAPNPVSTDDAVLVMELIELACESARMQRTLSVAGNQSILPANS